MGFLFLLVFWIKKGCSTRLCLCQYLVMKKSIREKNDFYLSKDIGIRQKCMILVKLSEWIWIVGNRILNHVIQRK